MKYQRLYSIKPYETFLVEETVELQGNVVDSQLQLLPKDSVVGLPGVVIRGNEIIVNQLRFVIHLGEKAFALA